MKLYLFGTSEYIGTLWVVTQWRTAYLLRQHPLFSFHHYPLLRRSALVIVPPTRMTRSRASLRMASSLYLSYANSLCSPWRKRRQPGVDFIHGFQEEPPSLRNQRRNLSLRSCRRRYLGQSSRPERHHALRLRMQRVTQERARPASRDHRKVKKKGGFEEQPS